MSAYDAHARERWAPEEPKASSRGDFARDRARVVHSSALRRLAGKTQVVGPTSDDFVRNRLTHTLEVAQVGRDLGAALGCDPDVVETACLAHDLGHPPFGHNGEVALDAAASGCGGFEGNAHTLRLLTRLEAKVHGPDGASRGLNLTRASLDAATKYPWGRERDARKYGAFDDDRAAFDWLRAGAPDGRRCVEAQVMDWADDVAYSVHDVEDAVQAGAVDLRALRDRREREVLAEVARDAYAPDDDPAALQEALDRLLALPWWPGSYDGGRRALAALKDMTSRLVGRFTAAAEAATRSAHGDGPLARYGADVVVPDATRREVAALKGVAAHYVMRAERHLALLEGQRAVLTELVHLLEVGAPASLAPVLREDWGRAADDAARRRVVVDQVAGLTDASALALHRALTARPARGGGT